MFSAQQQQRNKKTVEDSNFELLFNANGMSARTQKQFLLVFLFRLCCSIDFEIAFIHLLLMLEYG